MTQLLLVAIALSFGVVGTAYYLLIERIKVQYVRYRLRQELREVERELRDDWHEN